ncbi:hypothetical protein LTS12_028140 [Elasticomyces elasticus]|nr:hypothetical protein LTS12_028140 [Elasticomyces elasticus]
MPHERSFHRKDHLNQHLRLMHQVKFHPSMEKWRSTTTEIKSRCGFCGTNFITWKDRIEHLAAHFKDGANISQWQGDWGFEPFVLNLVENAMPPYLIGHEKNTVNPFKPSHTLGPVDTSSLGFATAFDVLEDTNAYRRLQQSLTVYIHSQLTGGTIPTDQMLQAEARRLIYGNDDSWNQTCADNPIWLSRLKRDAGLENMPKSDPNPFGNLDLQPPFASKGGGQIEPKPLARTISQQGPLPSPDIPGYSPGNRSPAPRTGRSSAAASGPGSSAGSYGGSTGAIHTTTHSALSTDWSGSYPGNNTSSFSTPVSGSVDPFLQMGFDPQFLQQLNKGYDVDELQGEGHGELVFWGVRGGRRCVFVGNGEDGSA